MLRNRPLPTLVVAAVGLALLVPGTSATAGPVPGTGAAFTVAASPGTTSTIPDWRLQSSAKATQAGDVISGPAYPDSGWMTVPARSTVMAGLIANNRYPDVTYSQNLKQVDANDFKVPWWYRKVFQADPRPGVNTFLKLNGGVISRGEIWLNGTRVAGTDTVVGAYPTHEFNVTGLLRKGDNALAIKASPADPAKDLVIHFIDWSQLPPDRNQGLFRDVDLVQSGAVSLRGLHVLTDLPLPNLTSATVTVKVDARNNTGSAVTTTVAGSAAGQSYSRNVSLAANETKTVTFTLNVTNPQVWWPFQMGAQPLYDATATSTVSGVKTDEQATTFGIREVTSKMVSGNVQYQINGKPILIRGGGWASDLFLRTNPRKIADELALTKSMGLNTIRLEGKPENDELYDLADRAGILVMTGWECCSKWQDTGGFTAEDKRVAGASAEGEAKRIRNHPSVFTFLIGSDEAPVADVETIYLDALRRADWQTPIITAAARRTSPQLGDSGMKMEGPYWWEPPVYWYDNQKGGSAGFASEIGPGLAIPEMDELKKFLSQSEINKLTDYNAQQYHLSPSGNFSKIGLWGTALDNRYGKPSTVDDFVKKAQLQQYETNRAQFEAFGRDFSDTGANQAQGVIYWMQNDPWPKLYWHLYNYNLATAGSYFGAKTANRALHVQYSYDDKSLAVVNMGLRAQQGLSVQVTVFNSDGTQKANETRPVPAKANGSARVGTLPQPSGLSPAYFVRLLLKDASGKVVDRNVYWLSTKADTLDYNGGDWWYTPQAQYTDLKSLSSLKAGQVSVSSTTTPGTGGRQATHVTIKNTGTSVAFFLRASLRKGQGGAEVLPVDWTDNYVTLFPGETETIRAEYRTSDLGGAQPVVELSGHNVSKR
ncbi:glycosyl hydrolase 2 galactose-binding domain-containing protein [Lentzea sp.]|uniref:glycosyl hydrolase 2 galactose-binding domain-containing protein n=1 Tax=Lentzea sp. TaxID=56099 RepID=UPI002CA2847F|nr:glycoside hydrolase family 2 TIM barrel-domain containing protein [Lentzea sp.]HUQ58996.1 glycoside hydrolase family 2 TIM barrel-domain containing protein [Lentzea sp.]